MIEVMTEYVIMQKVLLGKYNNLKVVFECLKSHEKKSDLL